MKVTPILFSAPMVNALLDGRKTQTRRSVKPQPDFCDGKIAARFTPDDQRLGRLGAIIHCPYGRPGDLLWVRETTTAKHAIETCVSCDHSDLGAFTNHTCRSIAYRADGELPSVFWTPGIHMPRWASRLTLRITEVRVQRLQEISEGDAKAEGCAPSWLDADDNETVHASSQPTYQRGFARLWRDINGAGSWDTNPWVWALTFEVIKANVDEFLKTANSSA